MNNLTVNTFMAAQAPMSSMVASGAPNPGQASQFVQSFGGDASALFAENGNQGGVAGDLDQLQQAYSRSADRGSQHHPIAEFLYQLTKMLTDDNSEIIEWVDGRIKVHFPERLEAEVLHKYFRHSKFASFQRQLNYFGFRKIAGKGKMSPCSYVNEAATSDIRSLLLIKRKTNGSAARKAAMAQRSIGIPGGMGQDLRANLSALAVQAAAGAGAQANLFNGQAYSNAAALLTENAHRASLGLGQSQGLGQFQMQQKALGGNLFNENAMSFLMSSQKQSFNDDSLQQQKGPTNSPSIEQLHAQLAASLANRQQHANSLTNLSSGAVNLATSAINLGGSSNDGPASAALNATASLNSMQSPGAPGSAMPATAAMNATAAVNAAMGQTNNPFDSATHLKSLVNEQSQRPGQGLNSAANQGLLNRLPSSNTLFPENLSTASFGNLLASSNRLSSLLSLNSFLSRDPSVADLVAGLPNGASQLAAGGAGAVGSIHDNKFGVSRFQ